METYLNPKLGKQNYNETSRFEMHNVDVAATELLYLQVISCACTSIGISGLNIMRNRTNGNPKLTQPRSQGLF